MRNFNDVLNFWFGKNAIDNINQRRYQLWFEVDASTDIFIRQRFTPYVIEAGEGKLHYWMKSPKSALALLILLDQFSRCIYRGLHASYRYDEYALALCKRGLATGLDHSLNPLERAFFFMPLMRSEFIEDQEECLFRFSQINRDLQTRERCLMESFLTKAEKNHATIKQFGRFPHRNVILSRLSTKEERKWLLNRKV